MTADLSSAYVKGTGILQPAVARARAVVFGLLHAASTSPFPDGRVETVVEEPGQPSGLGWLPDGRPRVVSMNDRRLLRLDGDALTVVADLSASPPAPCNDMLVDARGRAYIAQLASRHGPHMAPTSLIMVTPEGAARVAATDMHFPNGTVLTPDGRTLIVGESYGQRLAAFDVRADAQVLANRRVWAQLHGKGVGPNGLEGAVSLASPVTREVLRRERGGRVSP